MRLYSRLSSITTRDYRVRPSRLSLPCPACCYLCAFNHALVWGFEMTEPDEYAATTPLLAKDQPANDSGVDEAISIPYWSDQHHLYSKNEVSSTQSITSSILRYYMENGRRYHTFASIEDWTGFLDEIFRYVRQKTGYGSLLRRRTWCVEIRHLNKELPVIMIPAH